ncbi:MAG: Rieske (2Fe-2S) protein [Candidatus Eremiobacteraeota bacterium]|nr:Rieske (2Fe-2S) protein [Candidatus Eremiobacteraeota bacterium]
MLLALLGAALASFAAALIVPIRSLGPAPDGALFHTRWRKGVGLAREDGSLVRAGDLNVDSAIAVFPQDALGDSQSQATLIRLPDDVAGSPGGYIAYSRLCTHAGCPVALYRAQSKELLCPCHQSVFDVVAGGAVVSGPADRALPRLPIEVGGDGILRARGDFPEPVGPDFWERG